MRKTMVWIATILMISAFAYAQGSGPDNGGMQRNGNKMGNKQDMSSRGFKNELSEDQQKTVAGLQAQIETLKKSQEEIFVTALPNWDLYIAQEKKIEALQSQVREIITLARVEKFKKLSQDERKKIAERHQTNGNRNGNGPQNPPPDMQGNY